VCESRLRNVIRFVRSLIRVLRALDGLLHRAPISTEPIPDHVRAPRRDTEEANSSVYSDLGCDWQVNETLVGVVEETRSAAGYFIAEQPLIYLPLVEIDQE
jgi:hypothetical protein